MPYEFSRYGLLALIALLAIPVYSYMQFRKRSAPEAAMYALLLPWMFGPNLAAIDLPLAPAYGKTDFAFFGAALGLYLCARRRLAVAKGGRFLEVLVVMLLIGDFMRFWANRDNLWRGPTFQTGLSINDAIYYMLEDIPTVLLPLLIGRACFQRRADAMSALRLFVTFGLVYAPFILWEIRMSPQLHRQIYGYGMTYSFAQSMRDGGFRPEVFLQHGLILGMFVMVVTFAAFGLWRIGRKQVLRLPTPWVAIGLVALMVLVKAKGALVFTVVGAGTLYFLKPRTQMIVAAAMSLSVCIYAYLHMTGQFPADELMAQIEPFGEDRAQSMQFRLDNELTLAQRAGDRLWFGWGGYGRERVYDDEGHNMSTQDGAWIITLGIRGLFGFIAFFGALILPVLYALVRIGKLKDERDQRIVTAFAMMTAFLTLNMLPNMAIAVLPFLCAGATVGLTSGLLAEQQRRRKERLQARRAARRRASEESHRPPPPDDEPPPGGGEDYEDEEEPSIIINMPINVR